MSSKILTMSSKFAHNHIWIMFPKDLLLDSLSVLNRVPSCPASLMCYVLYVLTFLTACLPLCVCFQCVFLFLRALLAFRFTVFFLSVFIFLRALRAFIFHVPSIVFVSSFFTCLTCPHFFTCLIKQACRWDPHDRARAGRHAGKSICQRSWSAGNITSFTENRAWKSFFFSEDSKETCP